MWKTILVLMQVITNVFFWQGYVVLTDRLNNQVIPPCINITVENTPLPAPVQLAEPVPAVFHQTAGLGHTVQFQHGELEWPGGGNTLDQYSTCHPALQVEGTLFVVGTVVVDGDIRWKQTNGNYRSVREWFGHQNALREAPCIHGTLNLTDGACLCSPHWEGFQCDIHDCYQHGTWNLLRRVCICNPPWDGRNLCATRHCVDYNTTSTAVYTEQDNLACLADYDDTGCGPEMQTCKGICINNQCRCNQPGSMGRTCSAFCGTPVIDAALCPGRVNWGLSYTNNSEGIAVCGGGYDPTDPTVVVIKAVACGLDISLCLANFHKYSHICCAPGILCQDHNISGPWVSWSYFDTQPGPTIFNLATRDTTLAIYQRTCGTLALNPSKNTTCLRLAYESLQAEPWEALGAGIVYNSSAYSLGEAPDLVGFVPELYPLAPAIATATAMPVYFTPTNLPDPFYFGQQLFYIMAYPHLGDPFCLRDTRLLPLIHDGNNITAFWYRLEDSPGVYLNQADYCGRFSLYQDMVRKQSDGFYLAPPTPKVQTFQWRQAPATLPIRVLR